MSWPVCTVGFCFYLYCVRFYWNFHFEEHQVFCTSFEWRCVYGMSILDCAVETQASCSLCEGQYTKKAQVRIVLFNILSILYDVLDCSTNLTLLYLVCENNSVFAYENKWNTFYTIRMKTVVLKSAQVQNRMEYIHAFFHRIYSHTEGVEPVEGHRQGNAKKKVASVSQGSLYKLADSQRGEIMLWVKH